MEKTPENQHALISIIIPAYNAQATIVRCIDSLLAQTLKEWEAVIIDDGSFDATYDLCKAYCEKDWRLHLIHIENQGASFARNLGLDIARGEYLLFVDADDELMPSCLERMFCTIKNSDADILLSGISLVDTHGEINTVLPEVPYENRINHYWETLYTLQQSTGLVGYVSNKLYKKRLIDQNNLRFDTGKKVQEDLKFAISAFSHTKSVLFLNESYYLYYFIKKDRTLLDNYGMIDNALSFSEKLASEKYEYNIYQKNICWDVAKILCVCIYHCSNYAEVKHLLVELRENKRFVNMLKYAFPLKKPYYDLVMCLMFCRLPLLVYVAVRSRKMVSSVIHRLKCGMQLEG